MENIRAIFERELAERLSSDAFFRNTLLIYPRAAIEFLLEKELPPRTGVLVHREGEAAMRIEFTTGGGARSGLFAEDVRIPFVW